MEVQGMYYKREPRNNFFARFSKVEQFSSSPGWSSLFSITDTDRRGGGP